MVLPKARFEPIVLERSAQETLRFLAIGDNGTADENQYAVAQAMESRCLELDHLDGLLFLGDHFYNNGVTSAIDQQFEDKVEKPYQTPCLGRSEIFPILGNHDYRGSPDAFIEYSQINRQWRIPNRFYSVRFGDVLKLVAFDSNFPDFCFLSSTCAVDFLLQQLDTSTRWRLITAHHPAISASTKDASHSGRNLYGYLARWLTCNKADAFIAGHSHHLEYRRIDGCHEQFFIAGGGGARLSNIDASQEGIKFAASKFGFLELEITKEEFKFRFWDKDKQLLFEGSL